MRKGGESPIGDPCRWGRWTAIRKATGDIDICTFFFFFKPRGETMSALYHYLFFFCV